jgi:DNA helicase-2/ATP-dependent DNA helicase PcrA
MDDFTPQISWLKAYQGALDQAIAQAAERTVADLRECSTNFSFDLSETARELWNLSKGFDFCYDRPACGLAYGLWYQGRRVNALLPVSLGMIRRFAGGRLCVYDLGAGTGAAQWAMSLAWLAAKQTGMAAPASIRFVNVDSSPFMLRFLERGWEVLGDAFGELRAGALFSEQHLNDWGCLPSGSEVSCLFASYLFDSHEDLSNLKRRFVEVVTKLRPDTVILSTARQKESFLRAIENALSSHRSPTYESDWRLFVPAPPFAGGLECANSIRKRLRLADDAFWNEKVPPCLTVLRMRSAEGADTRTRPLAGLEGETLSICNPQKVLRTDLKLARDQLTASVPDGHPTVIYGPAGCGKSAVITERVRRLVESRANDPSLRILITAFNKALIRHVLVPWLKDLLDEKVVRWKPQSTGGHESVWTACWIGSEEPFLYVMHFDILPTRLGLVHRLELPGTQAVGEAQLRAIVDAVIAKAPDLLKGRRFNDLEFQKRDFEGFLRTDFLIEEYQRVFYGAGLVTREQFLKKPRPGRRIVQREGRPRAALWELISEIDRRAGEMDRPKLPITTFLARRRRLWSVLHDNGEQTFRDWIATHPEHPLELELSGKGGFKTVTGRAPWDHRHFFSHLFVDEVQDCHQADFWLLYKLLSDPNELVVAGDLAQAVHLGRSATTAFPRSKLEQRRRKTHELKGTYRLPLRISQALIPLHERIRQKRKQCEDELGLSEQHPYRGAPAGARPIVLWAHAPSDMAEKVAEVLSIYRGDQGTVGFDVLPTVILEGDSELVDAIKDSRRHDLVAEPDSILSVKGLEKACVIWSTRAAVANEQDVDEFVYTILTRTRSMLLIGLFPDTRSEFRPILNVFKHESLIFWDEDSRKQFDLLCNVDTSKQDGEEDLEPNPRGDDITEQDPVEAD